MTRIVHLSAFLISPALSGTFLHHDTTRLSPSLSGATNFTCCSPSKICLAQRRGGGSVTSQRNVNKPQATTTCGDKWFPGASELVNCSGSHRTVTHSLPPRPYLDVIPCGYMSLWYGAPFVTCTLLLTEANFVQQKSLLSDKSNFVYDKIIFVKQKLILSDKS